MATISEASDEAGDKMEDMMKVASGKSEEAIPSVEDMERDDSEETATDKSTMSVDKETLKAAMKEIKDEENLWYMVEHKNEDSLKTLEKLIAKRRAELKKGGGDKSPKAPSQY